MKKGRGPGTGRALGLTERIGWRRPLVGGLRKDLGANYASNSDSASCERGQAVLESLNEFECSVVSKRLSLA